MQAALKVLAHPKGVRGKKSFGCKGAGRKPRPMKRKLRHLKLKDKLTFQKQNAENPNWCGFNLQHRRLAKIMQPVTDKGPHRQSTTAEPCRSRVPARPQGQSKHSQHALRRWAWLRWLTPPAMGSLVIINCRWGCETVPGAAL